MADKNNQNHTISIEGSTFNWNAEEGLFQFQGEEAMLFWIRTAMKSFFDTLEEVSGANASNVVLETSGYKMGKIVSGFFGNESLEIKDILYSLEKIYAAAGWGHIKIESLDIENKTATVQLRNSWEYKINVEQGKKVVGHFLPGHWAGVLSALFETDIWYSVESSQIKGDDSDTFTFFPGKFTPEQNIHALAREREQEQIYKLEQIVAERTEELSNLVTELSSPILPVLEGVVVIPLLGMYDQSRSDDLLKKTMESLPLYNPNHLILDLTGLKGEIDGNFGELIHKLHHSVKLMGAKTIVVGISPQISMKIISAGYTLENLECFTTLKHAIHYVFAQQGKTTF